MNPSGMPLLSDPVTFTLTALASAPGSGMPALSDPVVFELTAIGATAPAPIFDDLPMTTVLRHGLSRRFRIGRV